MGTNFSKDTIFNQIQGGNVGYLVSMHKALAIAIVARSRPFFESVDSTVRLTAMIVKAGTLGTSAG